MNNDVCTGLRIVPLTADYPKLERLFEIRDEAFPANERPASREVSSYNENIRNIRKINNNKKEIYHES